MNEYKLKTYYQNASPNRTDAINASIASLVADGWQILQVMATPGESSSPNNIDTSYRNYDQMLTIIFYRSITRIKIHPKSLHKECN